MAFWVWVVAAIVVGLILFELFSWIRRRVSPPAELPEAEAEPVDTSGAELVRANMKIAVLESRLEEADMKYEEERAALQEQHRKQLTHTEAAYQRQMVALSERLAANGIGDWRVAVKRERAKKKAAGERYPVPIAAKVAAWKATHLEGTPEVETTVFENENPSSPDNGQAGDAPDPSLETPSGEMVEAQDLAAGLPAFEPEEDTAEFEQPYLPDVDDPGETWVLLEQENVPLKGGTNHHLEETGRDGENDPLDPDAWLPDHHQDVLDQITVLDESAESSRPEAPGEEREEKAMAFEELSDFENRWPDLEDQAMQRVMTRRLGLEMDADYLEDEEFLYETGNTAHAPEQEALSAEAVEDITGAHNSPADPLHEPAGHIENETPYWTAVSQSEEISDESHGSPESGDASDPWNEMAFAAAPAAYESSGTAGSEGEPPAPETSFFEESAHDYGESDVEQSASDWPNGYVTGEEAAIAATVAAILSRAPASIGQDEAYPDPYTPAETGGQDVPDTAVTGAEIAPANGSEQEQDPPSFVWERKPVSWEAQYYDNTRLADEPVVVRQDQEIEFDWRDRAPVEGLQPRAFSVRWSSVLPLDEGHYRFTVGAPDGLRLWLNGRLVISAWYDQSEQLYQRDFSWRGGSIDVCLEHYENGGDAKAFFTWDRIA